MKLILLTLTLLFASSSFAWGQAVPSATRADLQVGGSFSFVKPDYTPQDALGFGIYSDFFFTPHFGAELNFHHAAISQHSPAAETSFDYGVIYRRVYGIYRPFVRGSLGRGSLNFPTGISGPSASAADLSYNQFTIAGGVDFEVTRAVNVRAEMEYQSWFAAPGLTNGLTPVLFTIGAAYHFNPRYPIY